MVRQARQVFHNPTRKIGFSTALTVIIGNMIGTGIFTTTGLMLADFTNPLAILIAWIVGGLVALCGSMTYAELSVAMPESGGEFLYLSRLYHPALGFLSGWISLIAGFSAPIAAVAVGFAEYMESVYSSFPILPGAIGAVLIFSVLHLWHVWFGGKLHDFFTGVLLILILTLITVGIYGALQWDTYSHNFFKIPDWQTLLSPSFATGLILVMYAYSGWNAAAYLGGEVKNPQRTLPLALIWGTLIVTVLYTGLNVFYLMAAHPEKLAGNVEIAHIATKTVIGEKSGKWVSVLVSLACLSSLSAMIMTGPRVYQKMGEDFKTFQFLAKRRANGAPFLAVSLQALVAILLIVTFTFETILTYIGFTLSLFAGLTVAAVFLLRKNYGAKSGGYKTWGYPFVPLFFLLVMAWMVGHALYDKPIASIAGLGTVGVGGLIYWFVRDR